MLKPEAKTVAVEGNDGAGKSTHITILKKELEQRGLRVHVSTSPGNTLVGRALKTNMVKIPADRKNALFTYDIERTQRRVPANTDLTLWDRHLDSVIISNGDNGAEEVSKLAKDIQRPDRVVYLDLPPDISWEREMANTDHPISRDWLETKYRRYSKQIADEPDRFTVVDANQPLEKVHQSLLDILLAETAPLIEESQKMHTLLIDTPGVVRFELEKPVEVKPGVFLPMFVNLKDIWAKVSIRDEVASNLAKLVGNSVDWIIGLESGGNYFAVSIANMLKKPVSLFRKNAKDYSLGGMFVGEVPPAGARVAIIDDVYATGTSGVKAIKHLTETGCDLSFFSAYSYSNDQEMVERLGVPATALTYFLAMRQLAIEKGMLTQEQAETVTKLVDIYRHTIFS